MMKGHDMDVGSLCRQAAVTMPHGATLMEAARLMRECHVGALVVTSAPGPVAKVLGIVTDRDIVVGAVAQGSDVRKTLLSDIVAGEPVSVPDSTAVSETIAVMRRAGVRRLLVTTPDRRLAGVVSLDDLLGACAQDVQALAETVRLGLAHEAKVRRPLREATGLDVSTAGPGMVWPQVAQP
jgi:CBS domain-containing protein